MPTPTNNHIANFKPRIIFFDIDDTLSRSGVIDPRNKAMLEALAHTGIKLVIATGRPKPFLPEDIIALYDAGVFDAMITTNGQYSFDKQGIISHYPLRKSQIDSIHQICRASDLLYKFDSATHLAWASIDEHFSELIKDRPNAIIDADYAEHNMVYQSSVFFNHDTSKIQSFDFAKYGLKLVLWHHMGGDILPTHASKARAVRDVCAYFELSPDDAMAFGDGYNDIEMFELVGCAVAMGDAQPDLIAKADRVTGTIEEGGIVSVIEGLGL